MVLFSYSTGEASYLGYSPLIETPRFSAEIDHLREEVTVVKNKLQSLENSQQSRVLFQNEIKTFLSQITEMLNPATLARNAGFSQLGTNDGDHAEETTNDEN